MIYGKITIRNGPTYELGKPYPGARKGGHVVRIESDGPYGKVVVYRTKKRKITYDASQIVRGSAVVLWDPDAAERTKIPKAPRKPIIRRWLS